MTSLKGDLRSIMGTPFGGVGHAVLIFSRVTRAAFNSDSVVLQLHDRIEMPEEANGKFQVDGLDPGPIRIELEGGTVHNHGWNIDLPDEGVWSLTDLVDAQVDWSPAVIGRAEAAAREARDHADRAEAGADRVGTAEQVGVWADEASVSASDASSARYGALVARDAARTARDAAEGHADRAATSESNAAASESAAKQSEDNAGDYAAVATTAATEAVDAMERATDIAGGDFTTHEYVDNALTLKADTAYVDSATWLKPALDTSSNVDTLPSGLYPVSTPTVATTLGLPLGEPGELETTWLDPAGFRRRQTLYVDPITGNRPGYAIYRRLHYNGTWQPWARYDDAWYRGRLSEGSTLDSLGQGVYEVPTGAVAQSIGLPAAERGPLTIYYLGGGTYRRAVFDTDPLDGYKQYRATYYNGSWSAWQLVNPGNGGGQGSYIRGRIPESSSISDIVGSENDGLWTYSSIQATSWGMPSRAAGVVQVISSGFSTLQIVNTLTTPIQEYKRRWYNGSWSGDWESTGGAPEQPSTVSSADEYATATSKSAVNLLMPSIVDPTLSYEDDHSSLVDDLKSRLGTVVTGGKAAVALVADHGTTAFKEWLWAAAKERGIPFTMALAPEAHLDGNGDSRHAASNDDIKQWISEGLAIASHSGDHSGASGYFDVSRQIETSKAKLEEKLETAVDCWVQPGYTLDTGDYDGFGTGQSAERYTDHYAGRMLQQNYAVVTGYAGDDFVYPGDADLPVGVRRSLTERKDNQDTVLATIEQTIAEGGKHINFCHPYALPDESSTYVTKSEYIAYLDWLAAKRDAGDLVLLTLPQLAVARNTPPVVFERGATDWSITSIPSPGWNTWVTGRIYPPAGRYIIELAGGATAEVRPSATGESIISGSEVTIEPGDYILGMYAQPGNKIAITPL